MKAVEEFGNTVEEAREKALRTLGVRSAHEEGVTVEVLSEGSPGSTSGWGRKLARVRVTVEGERADFEEPRVRSEEKRVPVEEPRVRSEEKRVRAEEPRVRSEEPRVRSEEKRVPYEEPRLRSEGGRAPKRAPEDEGPQEILQEILDLMDIEASVEVEDRDGQEVFNLVGPDLAILIGKHGQTLEALQFLLSLMVNKSATDRRRIVVDVGGYRLRRERALRDLASRMARRAAQEQCTVALEPMQASERRIIHLALADDPEVETYSQGEEPLRKVIIAPRP